MRKKVKVFNLLQLIFNILIIGSVAAAFVLSFKTYKNVAVAFKYYYIWAAIICAVASALLIYPNIKAVRTGKDNTPRFFVTLAYIGALMSTVTLVFSLVMKGLNITKDNPFSFNDGELFLNIIIPALSIANLLFFEIIPTIKFKVVFAPFLAFVVYCAVIFGIMTYLHFTQGASAAADFAPFDFFLITKEWAEARINAVQTYVQNIVILVGLIVSSFGLSILIWCINRINSHTVIGVRYEEYTKEELENEKAKKADKKDGNEQPSLKFKRYDLNSKTLNDDINQDPGHIYHISYHDRRLKTWKVKAEEAERALKVFATQREAIIYAKELVAKNGGSIRIHSMGGKMRKDYFSAETAPVVSLVETKDQNNNTLKVEKVIEAAPAKVEIMEKQAAKEQAPEVAKEKIVSKKEVTKNTTKKVPAKKVIVKKVVVKNPKKPVASKTAATKPAAKKPAAKKTSKKK